MTRVFTRVASGWPGAASSPASHAMAMVAVPVLLGLLGAWLDGLAGTRPLLMLLLGGFGVACSFASAYYRYERRMARHDEGKPWARKESAGEGVPGDATGPQDIARGEIGEAPA